MKNSKNDFEKYIYEPKHRLLKLGVSYNILIQNLLSFCFDPIISNIIKNSIAVGCFKMSTLLISFLSGECLNPHGEKEKITKSEKYPKCNHCI